MQLLILWFCVFCVSFPSVHSRCKSIRLFCKCPCLWLSWLSLPAAFLILLHLSLEMGLSTVLNTPRIHMRWIWVVFYVLLTCLFIIFPRIQIGIFLSSSEHKSDMSIKFYIPMARSHFQVSVVNSELRTVYGKSKLGFFPPRCFTLNLSTLNFICHFIAITLCHQGLLQFTLSPCL